jgi:putative NADH-flavin reductase
MHIAIIGVTGGTGRHLLSLACAGGHTVSALARNPDKLEGTPEWVRRVRADARDVGSLRAALSSGVDAVVSIVGASGLLEARKVTDLYSVGTRNLIAACRAQKVPRLVVVSSSGVEPQPADGWFYVHVLKRFFLEAMYADMRRMEKEVQASELAWTIVRPPYLIKGEPTGNYRVRKDANFEDDGALRRGDLAHFLLRTLEEGDEYVRSVVRLSQ